MILVDIKIIKYERFNSFMMDKLIEFDDCFIIISI